MPKIEFQPVLELFRIGEGLPPELMTASVELTMTALKYGALAQRVDAKTSRVAADSGARRREAVQEVCKSIHKDLDWQGFALVAGKWFTRRSDREAESKDDEPATWKRSPYTSSTPWKREDEGRVYGGRAWGEFYSLGTGWQVPLSREQLALFKEISLDFLNQYEPGERVRTYRVLMENRLCALISDFSHDGERSCLAIALVPHRDANLIYDLKHVVLSEIGAYMLRIEHFHARNDIVATIATEDIGIVPAGIPERPQDILPHDSFKGFNAACALAAELLEISNIAVYVPDPQGEVVWCVGGSHLQPYALRTMTCVDDRIQAAIPQAPFAGQLATRNETLTFSTIDKGNIYPGHPAEAGCLRMIDAIDATRKRERGLAGQGPWVFAILPVSSRLAPVHSNAVIAFQGHDLSRFWIRDDRRAKENLHPDWMHQLHLVAMRIGQSLLRVWTDRAWHWAQRLSGQLTQIMTPGALCRLLAERLRADLVSVWALKDNELVLRWWSADPVIEPMRFAHAGLRSFPYVQNPFFQSRLRIGDESFLSSKWVFEGAAKVNQEFADLLASSSRTNVGTMPILQEGKIVGLLRVDGGRSIFSDLGTVIGQAEGVANHPLHDYKPPETPTHIRDAMSDAASLFTRWLTGESAVTSDGIDGGRYGWKAWVERVLQGKVREDDALTILRDLYSTAPTYEDIKEKRKIARSTFYRDLTRLADVLGGRGRIPWLRDDKGGKQAKRGRRSP